MLSKGSVLVVDDEVNLCRILGAKLAKNGFSVVAVHDGQQAIDKVREANFDVVLLDLILPKMDGLSALEEIRSLDGDLPIIVMTACESSEALERARSQGVCAYVNKPFDLDSLVDLVKTTSAGSARRQNKRSADSTVLFTKHQPVTLEILNGRICGVFPSRIEHKDEHTLSLLAPTSDGCVIDVSPRTPVRVGLAANDAYYSFNSYVLAVRSTQVPLIVLDKPGVIYRTQRRQSPRLSAEVGVRYGRIPDENARPDALASGRSCDVSAGGIKMVALDQLAPGDLVYLETEAAGSFGPITAVGEVLRSNQSDAGYVVAMRFKRVSGNLGRLLVD
jgi:CheY-like chemotaxis protein